MYRKESGRVFRGLDYKKDNEDLRDYRYKMSDKTPWLALGMNQTLKLNQRLSEYSQVL